MNSISIGLFRLALLMLISVVEGQQEDTIPEVLSSLKFPERLVFDVTKNKILHLTKTVQGLEKQSWDPNLFQISPLTYYYRNYSEDRTEINTGDPIHQFLQDYFGVPPESVYFLFESKSKQGHPLHSVLPISASTINEYVQNATNDKENPFTVVFNIGSDFYNKKLIGIVSAFKSKWKNVKVGVDYSAWGLYDNSISPALKEVDIAIVRHVIPPEEFILTYSQFKLFLLKTIRRNQNYIRKVNSDCFIYAYVSFQGESQGQTGKSKELYRHYYFYMFRYLVGWINEGENHGVILEEPSGAAVAETEMRAVVTPIIYKNTEVGSCEIKAVMDQISDNFDAVFIENACCDYVHSSLSFLESSKCVLTNGQICSRQQNERDFCDQPLQNKALPTLQNNYWLGDAPATDTIAEDFTKLKSTFHSLPWRLLEFDFRAGYNPSVHMKHSSSKSLTQALRQLPPSVAVGCPYGGDFVEYEDARKEFQAIREKCSAIWNQSSVVAWNEDFASAEIYHDFRKIYGRLNRVKELRELFSQKFPEKTVILNVNVQSPNQVQPRPVSLYCRADVVAVFEKVEFVVNFARLHNIPIRINTLLDMDSIYYEILGWWSALKPSEELNMTATRFPVFVARNYPKLQNILRHPEGMCLEWNPNFNKDIPIDPIYSGSTIYMDKLGKDMTSDELTMLMLFTFHKFSTVEIIPGSATDLKTVFKVISEEKFIGRVERPKDEPMRIYLGLQWKFVDEIGGMNSFMGKLEKIALKPEGIHFSSMELPTDQTEMISVARKLNETGIRVGLMLESCISEVNNRFKKLASNELFHHLYYVLCISQEAPTNYNRPNMETYLDTHLYISRYFKRMFPSGSTEIMFRLNYALESCKATEEEVNLSEREDFLGHLSDTSQYASTYQLRMFMVSAFDSDNLCGWWTIMKGRKLTDPSAFSEKESGHLGREAWRAKGFDDEKGGSNASGVFIIVLCSVVIILTFGLIVLRMKYKRAVRLLTKQEVEEFFNGKDNGEGDSGEGQPFENKGFPKEYELDKAKFDSLNVLGKGNFGTVYKTILSVDGNDVSAAVKIPHESNSKDSFKSILAELKILCYIGQHPHVLGFIGAYVKEIEKGTAFIATELCTNGALLDHLRRLQNELTVTGKVTKSNVDVSELSRFSKEIALGMDYIASKKIIHGDLSTRNVLLDSDLHCKIGDFGLSRKLYEYQEYVKQNAEPLPWRWMAVESLKRMEFTTKSDVWSYGVTVWEVFSLGNVPYPGLSWTVDFVEELENGLRMPSPTYASEPIYDKMKDCWNNNPKGRPTFAHLADFFDEQRKLKFTSVENTDNNGGYMKMDNSQGTSSSKHNNIPHYMNVDP